MNEDFRTSPTRRWHTTQVGGGRLIIGEQGLRLALLGASNTAYADAQIDDYARLPRRRFPWRAPLRMTVRARASGVLSGTAGFGFWNNPFSPFGGWPAPPSAIWFFHAAPPSDMPLAGGVPGHGWKVATIDTARPAALALAPLALPVALLNRVPPLQRRVWPPLQRHLRIAEATIPPLGAEWRCYTLEWLHNGARFLIDGESVLETACSPAGSLGFVAWIDNQWMVATPQGRFGWGLSNAQHEWLDLGSIRTEQLVPGTPRQG